MIQKFYTEDDVRAISKSIKKYFDSHNIAGCDFEFPELKPVEVSVIAFKHSEEKIVLEVTEKHIDDTWKTSADVVFESKHDDSLNNLISNSKTIDDFSIGEKIIPDFKD